ncbi:sugar ABC transporter ATP-binding protein [Amycolatopsis sp. GM8]|uniref:sugar ABC transporter ATP-binding protein n=1 Tax=Amycolatopsis sp. GM8 TaxID=2896530 RepID=UPI001F3EE5D6|nr:sugar ABC transporter ATP-binding protein [Amycolatopsis sp. GM8]
MSVSAEAGAGRGPAALSIEHLTKTFTGTHALSDVSVDVAPGTVHALLGGNGSGKSTLIKVLAGVHRADPGGIIRVAQRSVPADQITPAFARDAGLRFVHQDPGVFPEMTVAENIGLVNGFGGTPGTISWTTLRRRTALLLERFGIAATPDQELGSLRPADQTMVAIARALEDAEDLNILVLDEPTATLPKGEVDVLLESIKACSRSGQTIVFVSHRIDEVLSISDDITVLRDGHKVVTRANEGLVESDVVRYIVGRPVSEVLPHPPERDHQQVFLSVRGLRGGPLADVTFTASRGEVVGIAGLLGSGRTELLRMLAGAMPADGGEVRLDGETIRPRSVGDGIKHGIAYVPEDRALDAALSDLSVEDNLSIADLNRYRAGLLYRHRREHEEARADIRKFGIKTRDIFTPLSQLSGGNQQKVILARWLRLDPRLLLLDEPTQGVDVGARADVYALIDDAVEKGLTVVLVSSDFTELSRVTDRVLVLSDGRIGAELAGADATEEMITELVYSSSRSTQ